MVFERGLAIRVEFWKIWGEENGQRYFRGAKQYINMKKKKRERGRMWRTWGESPVY